MANISTCVFLCHALWNASDNAPASVVSGSAKVPLKAVNTYRAGKVIETAPTFTTALFSCSA